MANRRDRREQRERDNAAARLEREARDSDRRARQHLQWSIDEASEGRPNHSRMWAAHADRDIRKADQLRRDAESIRSSKN